MMMNEKKEKQTTNRQENRYRHSAPSLARTRDMTTTTYAPSGRDKYAWAAVTLRIYAEFSH